MVRCTSSVLSKCYWIAVVPVVHFSQIEHTSSFVTLCSWLLCSTSVWLLVAELFVNSLSLFLAQYLPSCSNILSFAHNAVNLTTVLHNVMYFIYKYGFCNIWNGVMCAAVKYMHKLYATFAQCFSNMKYIGCKYTYWPAYKPCYHFSSLFQAVWQCWTNEGLH